MTPPSRRLGYSNNQLNYSQVKNQFQVFENHLIKSLKLTFNLLTSLTGYSSSLAFSSVSSLFGIGVSELGFCVFLKNNKTNLRQFFSGFRRKHLFFYNMH